MYDWCITQKTQNHHKLITVLELWILWSCMIQIQKNQSQTKQLSIQNNRTHSIFNKSKELDWMNMKKFVNKLFHIWREIILWELSGVYLIFYKIQKDVYGYLIVNVLKWRMQFQWVKYKVLVKVKKHLINWHVLYIVNYVVSYLKKMMQVKH